MIPPRFVSKTKQSNRQIGISLRCCRAQGPCVNVSRICFALVTKRKVLKKSTLLLAISMTVLPTWGPGKSWSDEDHSREFPQASTQQSWVKAVPLWDASPGSLWSCTTTCTIEAVELGNLFYDSPASSASEYFIKSCHYWPGSLPSVREDSMEVPG